MARKFLTNIDLNLNQLLNSLAHILASDPGSPTEAQFWYNSTGKVLKFRNDSATITLGRLDQISAPTASVSLNSQKIVSLQDGSADSDAATVGQLNAAVRGFDWKQSVRAATTANGTLASAYENGDTIDGVTLSTGDRILIKNQTTGSENGIYTVNASGAPTRATDADSNSEVTGGMTVLVEEGSTNADTGWTLTNDGAITLGSTALTFVKTMSQAVATGTVNKYSASVGNGSATSFNVDHNLGTLDVVVQVFTNSDGTQVEPDVTHSTTNRVVLDFAVAPTSNQYRVVVLG
jgi:phage-related tail fiber protein